VAWHRVVRSDGTPAPHIRARQLALLREEGVPIDGERVQMSRARWDGST
jgi:alkylated DNA nucleotide flippase Atl1